MSRNGNGKATAPGVIRCAIYTRKSTEEGLQQEFNSLDAQREAGEAYIASQRAEGWVCLPVRYDDGGFTGGNMDRPALKRLMADIDAGQIDCVVVYKVDRLSRSLLDFSRIMETFDRQHVSFVSVTQQFNTTHSMGRLTLNILFSFAQFEREIISERTRDKIAATRRKGKWCGGRPILGYDVVDRRLVTNAAEVSRVREIFELYLAKQSLLRTARELNARGWTTKCWTTGKGRSCGGRAFNKIAVLSLVTNAAYVGKVRYKAELHTGEHEAIVDPGIWERVQQMLRANGRGGGSDVRNKYGALLRGLLFCQPCNRSMSHSYTVKNGSRAYRYYVCQAAQKNGRDACPSKSIPAEQIEQFVVAQIRGIGKDPGVIAATLERASAGVQERLAAVEAERRAAERELRSVEMRVRRAVSLEDGNAGVTLAELQDQAGAAERRLSVLRIEIEGAKAQRVNRPELETALAEFDGIWGELAPREQARVLRLLIQRIDYDGAAGKVRLAFRPHGPRALATEGRP